MKTNLDPITNTGFKHKAIALNSSLFFDPEPINGLRLIDIVSLEKVLELSGLSIKHQGALNQGVTAIQSHQRRCIAAAIDHNSQQQ